MPNVRKEIYNRIARDLINQASSADQALWKNKYELKKLSEEQRELKKKRSELHRLFAEFTGKIK